MSNRIAALLCPLVLLAACATTERQQPAPISSGSQQPTPEVPIASEAPPPPPVATLPAPVAEQPPRPTQAVQPALPPQPLPTWADPHSGRLLLDQLLPKGIKDRVGWESDIFTAFTALKIPYTAEYFCGAMAVIEQESSWQADPVVPGLGKDVWKELETRAHQHGVPFAMVKAGLQMKSRNGRSYAARIDALKTEREMNALFEEMMDDAQGMGLPVNIKNPIRTGGPMQVSVDFADAHVKAWPYPYQASGSVRHEVFSRRGGVYFGIAHLLHYRVNYPAMLYRFADFNAGRYSSRNAAFQLAVGKLARRKIVPDGDLLRYDGQASQTDDALKVIGAKLGLSQADIRRDLAQEKAESFAATPLYARVFALADQQAHRPVPRQALPQIRLVSTKITRKLTTAWFAQRVDGRFQQCMLREPKH